MKWSAFAKEKCMPVGPHFLCYIIISNFARDVWRSLLTSFTGGEALKMPRECAAVGCTELRTRESALSFHTFSTKDPGRTKAWTWSAWTRRPRSCGCRSPMTSCVLNTSSWGASVKGHGWVYNAEYLTSPDLLMKLFQQFSTTTSGRDRWNDQFRLSDANARWGASDLLSVCVCVRHKQQ